MATPVTLPSGLGYDGWFDCAVVTPKIGGTSWPDALARETIGGVATDHRELSIIPASPPFKTLQFVSSRIGFTSGGVYHAGLFDFWTWITANPSVWGSIGWGQIFNTQYFGGAWQAPTPGTIAGYGVPGQPGIYGKCASLWEWWDYGSGGPGSFDQAGVGSSTINGAVVLLASPTAAARNFNVFKTSEKSDDIDSYGQTNVASGTLSPAANVLIPLPYDTLPSTPPMPQAPLDLTDANNYNNIGLANFFAWA